MSDITDISESQHGRPPMSVGSARSWRPHASPLNGHAIRAIPVIGGGPGRGGQAAVPPSRVRRVTSNTPPPYREIDVP